MNELQKAISEEIDNIKTEIDNNLQMFNNEYYSIDLQLKLNALRNNLHDILEKDNLKKILKKWREKKK